MSDKALGLLVGLVAMPWMAKQADRIVQFGDESKYFSLGLRDRTRYAQNGFDAQSVKICGPPPSSGPLRLLGVARMGFWHGFDRVINALRHHAPEEVQLTLVGDGPAVKELKDLVATTRLESLVTFRGHLSGSELDEVFDHTDVAIGSLGLHRIGLSSASPLKNREYLARGLPVIFAGHDPQLEAAEALDLARKVPSGDDPLDLRALSQWMLGNRTANVRSRCRDFAADRLGWEHQVQAYLPDSWQHRDRSASTW
jgi:hypothetical protein